MAWFECTGGSGGGTTVTGYRRRYFGTLIPNVYIDNNNGTAVSYNNWSATDFLEITGDETSVCRVGGDVYNDKYNAFYDENKVFISSFNTSDNQITIPQNAKYVRFSNITSTISSDGYFYYYFEETT